LLRRDAIQWHAAHYAQAVWQRSGVARGRPRQLQAAFQRLDSLQHFIHMAGHLQSAPFLFQQAVSANQESASLDAFDLLAVHDFVFHHAKHVAHLSSVSAISSKGNLEFGLELVV